MRIGKAYAGLEKHKAALSRFRRACQLLHGSSQINYEDLLYEIAMSHSKCGGMDRNEFFIFLICI